MDAKLLRCRAAIHVENKDDIVFWETIFHHFRPRDRFHFIAGSRNENGRETKGVTQCLKYLHYLNPSFFICIDSDYRYLLQERKINIQHYVFQTYTYSFENHHCYGNKLNDVCFQVTQLPNDIFDFNRFLNDYSHIVYELFIWHLYFLVADPKLFPASEFNELITLSWGRSHPDISHNGQRELERVKRKVRQKTIQLHQEYPKANLDILKKKYRSFGLSPETTYFFLRGHNIYDMVYMFTKEVCKTVLRRAKAAQQGNPGQINLFGYRYSIDTKLKQLFSFGQYDAIRKIEDDISYFFNSSPSGNAVKVRL